MTVFLTESCNPKKTCWKKRFIPKEKDLFSRHDFVHKVFCRQCFCGVICLVIPKSGRSLEEEQWLLYRFPVSHLRLMWSISRTFLEMFKSGILFLFCTFGVIIQWMIVHLPTWQFALKQTCWGFGGFKFVCVCVFSKRYTKTDAWNLIPEFHHPSMDVMSWLNPVGPMDSEVRKMRRCRSFTPCTDRPLEATKSGWLGDFLDGQWTRGGGCYRSRMTWVFGPKWNDHKVLDTPKWLKGWRSTSNGGVSLSWITLICSYCVCQVCRYPRIMSCFACGLNLPLRTRASSRPLAMAMVPQHQRSCWVPDCFGELRPLVLCVLETVNHCPIGSMVYFTYISFIFMVSVGKYTIHGSFGIGRRGWC